VKHTRLVIAIATGGLLLTGCSSAGKEEAQAAYDACLNPKADTNVLRLDGSTVHVELVGDAAKSFSDSDDAVDNLENAGEFDDDDINGLVVGMLMLTAVDCMVEKTNYPGSSDDLTDGDKWEGWKYTEKDGTGAEMKMAFSATS
jgi:outer membrane murein-binding lipoprotein Lpp